MSTPALSEAQLRAQAKSVFGKVPGARVMGIQVPGPWAGADVLTIDGEPVEVAFCPSALALRERLSSHTATSPRLVLLTDRTETELGMDVLARLAKRRLHCIEPWRAGLDLFRARYLDPGLPRDRALAEALLEWAPPEGYPPVPAGVLDADTVWDVVARRVGLDDARPDARALLRWTLVPEHMAALDHLPEGVRAAFIGHLSEVAGHAGRAILRTVSIGRGAQAVPIGLVLRVLFSPAVDRAPEVREARVRLEPMMGGEVPDSTAALEWADAAEAAIAQVAATEGVKASAPWLDRAETVLRDVRAEAFAHLSGTLLSGFEQRLAHLASVLRDVLAGGADVAALSAAEQQVLAHAQATERADRGETAQMACRLVRWLRWSAPEPASLADAVSLYAAHGAFADLARSRLWQGDANPAVSTVYQDISERSQERRERENRRFAELLAGWTALGSADDSLTPVEDILRRVVVPLAEQAPLLLLVVDGMSLPVFQELLGDLTARGWLELGPDGCPARRVAIAALPTVTEVSRTSLLAGALRRGDAQIERDAFASHGGLVAASRVGFPPVLFHKSDLVEPGGVGLAAAVAAEIGRPARQVVGVVINAVDDHLAKGDQIGVRWTVDAIVPLQRLLDAARDAGRAIVLTSDHGHVIHRDAEYRRHDADTLRYRQDDGVLGADEIVLHGPRVLAPWGNRIVAPWSERVRYGVKQNGYHGGATPQEVIVPLAVLLPAERHLAGWSELPRTIPEWWDVPAPEPITEPAPRPAPARPGRRAADADAAQGQLFPALHAGAEDAPAAGRGAGPTAAPAPSAAAAGGVPAWIDRLLASPIYAAQKALASRPPVEDERVRACLAALEARGGKLTRPALARALGLPLLRVTGLVAALRRLLNVDGYPVLGVDDASDTLELNRALLISQFELDR